MHFKKTTLKNGLRVITVPMKETQTATIMVAVGVGSRFETEKEAGLSHFIEHMLFKGTEKRPTTLHISEELDAIGGEFNAFTSKDRTMYYAKADAKHIETILDVLSDMYLNSKLDEKEINKEKGTIIQELNMYEDMPIRNVEDVFEKLLYPKNNLGREIVGYKKSISSFKRKDFVEYMNRFYMANDTVICVAGKIEEEKIIAQMEKAFSAMKKSKKEKIVPVEEDQKAPALRIKFKKTDQTHLVVGVRAYHENHKDRYALVLLGVILGGSMSSRLFIEVREKRGLAYYVRTGVESYEDTGYFVAKSGVEHENLELALATILKEFQKISQEEVSEKELQKAKDLIKGKTVMGMEASDEVAAFFLDQEMARKKMLTLQEKFALIDKISSRDILRVAKDIFKNEKLNLAVIGPHKNGAKLKKILKLS
jgi:predicted Zn-dependent peptidase